MPSRSRHHFASIVAPFAALALLCAGIALAAETDVSSKGVSPGSPLASATAAKGPAHKKSVRFDAARCAVPDSMITQVQPLERVARRLRNDEPIKIVALGSSSTAGAGSSSPNYAYPARLAVELLELWPRAQLTVINRGVGGERTPQMIARFEKDVFAENPDLVIWQVGTNSALQGDPLEAGRQSVIGGIAAIKAHGIDVMLMSQQFAPRFNERKDHLLRVEAVRGAAEAENVGMFRRFQIMQSWLARGQMTFATMLSADGLHLNDLSYGCVAHLLARQIVAASRPTDAGLPNVASRPPAAGLMMPSEAPASGAND